MTKEELEKEAIQYAVDYPTRYGKGYKRKDLRIAYLAGTELREKRRAELTEQNTSLLTSVENLNKSVQELEDKLANADYQLEGRDNEIRKLNEQIEKMKCCGNCQKLRGRFDSKTNINILYCSDSDMKQIEVGFQMCCCKWEMKENE